MSGCGSLIFQSLIFKFRLVNFAIIRKEDNLHGEYSGWSIYNKRKIEYFKQKGIEQDNRI